MKFCRLQTVCVPRFQECTPFRKIKVWLLLPELPSSRKQAVPPTVVCNKFFLFHIISILPFKIYLPQNISVGLEVRLNFKYLILADGWILEYPHSGSGEKRSVINIGDNFLPTPPHTITTANVDVNILPPPPRCQPPASWPPVSLSWITLTPWSAVSSTSMPGHTYPCNTRCTLRSSIYLSARQTCNP